MISDIGGERPFNVFSALRMQENERMKGEVRVSCALSRRISRPRLHKNILP